MLAPHESSARHIGNTHEHRHSTAVGSPASCGAGPVGDAASRTGRDLDWSEPALERAGFPPPSSEAKRPMKKLLSVALALLAGATLVDPSCAFGAEPFPSKPLVM